MDTQRWLVIQVSVSLVSIRCKAKCHPDKYAQYWSCPLPQGEVIKLTGWSWALQKELVGGHWVMEADDRRNATTLG